LPLSKYSFVSFVISLVSFVVKKEITTKDAKVNTKEHKGL